MSMKLLDIQRELRELGRLRMGTKDPGRGFPTSISTWRLTSPNENQIEAAAELWGGTPEPWEHKDQKQFQVVTTASKIPVRVPGQTLKSQFELWSRAGRLRRCDGEKAWTTSESGEVESDCLCESGEDRECSLRTVFRFVLPDLLDIGVWVFTSGAFTAARELVPAVEMFAGSSADLSLIIEQRETRRPGSPVKKFNVAVLSAEVSMRSLLEGGGEPHSSLHVARERLVAPALPPSEVPIMESVEVLPPSDSEVGEETTFGDGGGTSAEVIELGAVRRSVTDIVKDVQEQAWVALLSEIEASPDGTMDENEIALRSLFRRMEAVGLWGEADRTLHAALAKAGVGHVRDLRAAELRSFCVRAWDAAKTAVSEAD